MATHPLKKMVGGTGNLMANRRNEIIIGLVAFLLGCFLLWDAFDGRGKKLPWPASAVTPW